MVRQRRILRFGLGVTISLLLLAGIAYMVRSLHQLRDRDAVTLFDPQNPDASKGDSRHAYWMAEYERVPLATVPWQRIVDAPLPASLVTATPPWVHDMTSRPAMVAAAELPLLRPRRILARAEPANVPVAASTWSRRADEPAGARVELAELPRLKIRRLLASPDLVALPEAQVPWTRDVRQPHARELPIARLPSHLEAKK